MLHKASERVTLVTMRVAAGLSATTSGDESSVQEIAMLLTDALSTDYLAHPLSLKAINFMPLTPRSTLLTVSLILALVGLAGCGGGGPEIAATQQPLVWVRTDGQSGKANPALADQFSKDREACNVSAQADNGALLAARDCMAKRGYVLVSADQAEATAAKFRSETAGKFTAKPGH